MDRIMCSEYEAPYNNGLYGASYLKKKKEKDIGPYCYMKINVSEVC